MRVNIITRDAFVRFHCKNFDNPIMDKYDKLDGRASQSILTFLRRVSVFTLYLLMLSCFTLDQSNLHLVQLFLDVDISGNILKE